mmetsp:Transcript_8691/g.19506  ORF Transcript_8691/g.19506 Transcript_8691/m.19506 type:complete len:164 (-) Transcript_8691:383-874(-)
MTLEPGFILMPLYAMASWYGLITQANTGKHLLPISLIGWLWAGINIARSKRLDLGIVTFGLVLLASICERYYYGFTRGLRWGLTISCFLVAANFSLVVIFWKPISKDLARSNKSQMWMKIFWSYCACMMVFWLCAGYKNQMRGENLGSSSSSAGGVSYDSVQQ